MTIYIYIYSHPQTDCFIVSQVFRVTRHVGRLKLGSKPTQNKVRLSIIQLSQQANHVSTGNISHNVVAFVVQIFALRDTRELNSFEELSVNSFVRVLHTREINMFHVLSSSMIMKEDSLDINLKHFSKSNDVSLIVKVCLSFIDSVSWKLDFKETQNIMGVSSYLREIYRVHKIISDSHSRKYRFLSRIL